MSDFPRARNGHVDDGRPIQASNRRDNSPSCGSARYRETLSREKCDSCGYEVDYWGKGPNGVAQRHEESLAAQARAEKEEREARERREDGHY